MTPCRGRRRADVTVALPDHGPGDEEKRKNPPARGQKLPPRRATKRAKAPRPTRRPGVISAGTVTLLFLCHLRPPPLIGRRSSAQR